MMAPVVGKVLLVGVEDELGLALREALEARGHELVSVHDADAAPQRAMELGADVVIIDASVGVLELRASIDLLRSHPKTEAVHLIVMDFGEMSHVAALDARAEPIVKPFFVPEVVAHVGALIERKHESKDKGELRGELAQVALFDLLQVLSSSRRTGRLHVEGERMAGDIWIADGRVVDATQGYAVGEKAMYRLLSVDTGRFVFTPALVTTEARIDAGTDAIVMEGVRRIDETKKAIAALPGERARYRVAVSGIDLPPLAQALVGKLEAPSLLREILDLSDAPDLEVLEMLLLLLETNVVEVDEASMNARLLTDEGTETALRSAILRLRRKGVDGPIRLGVLGGDRAALARFSRALGLLPEFVPPAAAPVPLGSGLLGELGRVRVSASELQLFALPTDAEHRPLVGALLGGSRVALHLGGAGESGDVEALARHLDLTLVRFDASSDHPAQAVAALREALGVEP
jgi:CheY-like chemotaxis protein